MTRIDTIKLGPNKRPGPARRIMVAVFAAAAMLLGPTVPTHAQTLTGAGASFPYPVYSLWGRQYYQKTGAKLSYQSIGSGGGIAQIKNKTVVFGASDAPLKKEELDKAGLMQWPMIMGGVVPVYHLPGVESGKIRLSGEMLADIFMGKITRWNDPALKKTNPGVNLPNKKITVVHRSDGAGTTWIFTHYLQKASRPWKSKVGFGKAVQWPVGIGGKGNEGVANYVGRVDGAIGYVEYAYALQNKLSHVKLENLAGQFVEPSRETFQAAAASADWKNAPGMYLVLTNQPGGDAWPITGASFILMYKHPEYPDQAREALKFFDWAYAHGDEAADKLDYVPMPDSVVKLIHENWKSQMTTDRGGSVWQGSK